MENIAAKLETFLKAKCLLAMMALKIVYDDILFHISVLRSSMVHSVIRMDAGIFIMATGPNAS